MEFYRAIGTEDPVHFDEKLGVWLVSRYHDVMTVLREPTTYSSKAGYEAQYAKGFFEEFKDILIREGGGCFFFDAIMEDPSAHTRVRGLMEKAFTAHRVAMLTPVSMQRVVTLIESLADKAEREGSVDVVAAFAVPLTTAIFAEQLGISEVDARARSSVGRWPWSRRSVACKLPSRCWRTPARSASCSSSSSGASTSAKSHRARASSPSSCTPRHRMADSCGSMRSCPWCGRR